MLLEGWIVTRDSGPRITHDGFPWDEGYIYLPWKPIRINGIQVGKYTNPMDPMRLGYVDGDGLEVKLLTNLVRTEGHPNSWGKKTKE